MKKNNYLFILLYLAILFLGIFLRIYKLSDVPPGVNQDEASIGYTAYSLIHTGKDEYGRSFPLSFQSFGDWKLPLYIYESLGSVALFGLTAFAVRIPSALAGMVTVALIFFLAEELFHKRTISFLSMVLLAIAPWSLHLSRVESESNTAVMFTVLGTLLFLKSRIHKPWLLIPSAILFALCYFTYAGNYVFTTFFVIGLGVLYFKEIARTKYLYIAVSVFLVMSAFIITVTMSANHTKLTGISIFGDPSIVHAQIEIPRNEHTNPQAFFPRLVHNRVIFAIQRFLQNYTNTFSANFLFINGGTNHAHNIENFGNMYIVEALFLFLGLVFLIALHKGKNKQIVLWWFFISPLAASITKDAPHTNRTASIIPVLPIIVAFGLWWAIILLKKRYFQYPAVLIIALAFCLNFAVYMDQYYIHFPRDEQDHWGKPYQVLSTLLTSQKFANKHIVMTQPEASPYIYLLFYQKYDPRDFQYSVVRYPPTEDGFVHVKSFGRYEFREIDWNRDLHTPNTVLVDVSINVPQFVKNDYSTTSIMLASHKELFTVVETK